MGAQCRRWNGWESHYPGCRSGPFGVLGNKSQVNETEIQRTKHNLHDTGSTQESAQASSAQWLQRPPADRKEGEPLFHAHPNHSPRRSQTKDTQARPIEGRVRRSPVSSVSTSHSCRFDDVPRVRCPLPRLCRGLRTIATVLPAHQHRALRPARGRRPTYACHAPRAALAGRMTSSVNAMATKKVANVLVTWDEDDDDCLSHGMGCEERNAAQKESSHQESLANLGPHGQALSGSEGICATWELSAEGNVYESGSDHPGIGMHPRKAALPRIVIPSLPTWVTMPLLGFGNTGA